MEKDLRLRHPDVDWAGGELKELNEAMWDGLVENALVAANKSETDLEVEPKGALWKAGIARTLQFHAQNASSQLLERNRQQRRGIGSKGIRKVWIASEWKRNTSAPTKWIAKRLNMGAPQLVGVYVNRLHR